MFQGTLQIQLFAAFWLNPADCQPFNVVFLYTKWAKHCASFRLPFFSKNQAIMLPKLCTIVEKTSASLEKPLALS